MTPFALPFAFGSLLERCVGLSALTTLYNGRRAGNFVAEALRLLAIEVHADALERIPQTGPVVIVANHPCGGLDGLTLAHLAQQRRPDVKLLANRLLLRVPELRDHVIGIDAFTSGGRATTRGLREASRWLSTGGALIVFPAGEVSRTIDGDGVVDGTWHRGAVSLAERSGATVVPMFIHGRNRRIFYAASRLHPVLATALLPRELLARRHSVVRVSIGQAVRPDRLRQLVDRDARVSYLRARTYACARTRRRATSH